MATGTAVFPGQFNTFVPSTEATNNMIVDFSRNPRTFAHTRYCKMKPVNANVGYYTLMTVEECGRILNTNGSDWLWADGADSPSPNGNDESFAFVSYKTFRYARTFALGQLATQQASWDILAQYSRIYAQQAMTLRSQLVLTLAQTSGNYGSNTSAVGSITGSGYWDQGTTANKYIKTSLDYAADQIRQATVGAVLPGDLILVISPGAARKMARCQEFVNAVIQSPFAKDEVEGKLGPNAQYGLPSRLWGYEIVVDDTVKVTSRKGQTRATSYIMDDNKPFMVSRPGGLMGVDGVEDFSSLTIFNKEEFTVESKFEPDHRRNLGRITMDFVPALTAPSASFLFTSAFSF